MRSPSPSDAADGLSVRVFSNDAVSWPGVTCDVGLSFHVLLRKSTTRGAPKVTFVPTRTGSASETYGGVCDWFADDVKFVDAPSSRTTPRAVLSAAASAASGLPGRPTSVGWRSGVVPTARPTSPYWFVEYVFETVMAPCGAMSIDSIASRSVSFSGQAISSGTASPVPSGSDSTLSPGPAIWVSPLNSAAVPVTMTWSPIVWPPAPLPEPR